MIIYHFIKSINRSVKRPFKMASKIGKTAVVGPLKLLQRQSKKK